MGPPDDDIIAELPDGTELSFPAGTNPDVVRATVKKHLGVAEPAGPRPGIYENASNALLSAGKGASNALLSAGKGAVKGVVQTLTDLTTIAPRAFHTPDPTLPGGAMHDAAEFAKPQNTAEGVGKGVEQVAEYVLPGMAVDKLAAKLPSGAIRLAGRMAGNAAVSSGLAAVHGEDPKTAAIAGAAGPLVGSAVAGTGAALGRRALPLVKSGLKIADTQVNKLAGAAREGIDAKVDEIAQFVLDNRLTSKEAAEALIQKSEQAVQTAATGAPGNTAVQFQLDALDKLAAKAAQQSNGGTAEIARINEVKQALLQGPLTRPVVSMGQAVRVPRTDVSPTEALDRARTDNAFNPPVFGAPAIEKQITTTKNVGLREAAKAAAPAIREPLRAEGMAIRAKKAFVAANKRQGNREGMSVPLQIGLGAGASAAGTGFAVGGVATGGIAAAPAVVLGLAAHWLRNNPVKAGIYAKALSDGIARQDVQTVGAILQKLGVGTVAEAGTP